MLSLSRLGRAAHILHAAVAGVVLGALCVHLQALLPGIGGMVGNFFFKLRGPCRSLSSRRTRSRRGPPYRALTVMTSRLTFGPWASLP